LLFSERLGHRFPDGGGAHRYVYTRFLHRAYLVNRLSASPADNGARMPHPLARGRGLPADEADDRLFHVLCHVVRGDFLLAAADFADHHDGIGFRVLVEKLDDVEKSESVNGVAPDTDTCGLPDPA